MPSWPPWSHSTQLFHEIQTPTENKHARIVVIGQQQIQKSMKLSQIEKRIPQTLPNSKDVIQKAENMLAAVAGPDQRAAKKMRPGHRTKKIHPGCPRLTFPGTDTQLYQNQPPLLEIHLLEGYICSLETNATAGPSKLHVPLQHLKISNSLGLQ